MPNHYTTIGIFSPGYEFDADAFNEQHKDTDFCRLVKPMPEPLEDVHIGHTPEGMHRWKETDGERFSVDEVSLQRQHGHPDWYEWAKAKWGTKWGTYHAKAFHLGGDGAPVVIKFQSAWSAPKILDEIAAWICKAYGFEKYFWVGFDPYDHSVNLLDAE
jgi:hypothetical protein